MTLSPERQSARMSKITNNGYLSRSGKGCFITVPIRQQWGVKGLIRVQLYSSTETGACCELLGTRSLYRASTVARACSPASLSSRSLASCHTSREDQSTMSPRQVNSTSIDSICSCTGTRTRSRAVARI